MTLLLDVYGIFKDGWANIRHRSYASPGRFYSVAPCTSVPRGCAYLSTTNYIRPCLPRLYILRCTSCHPSFLASRGTRVSIYYSPIHLPMAIHTTGSWRVMVANNATYWWRLSPNLFRPFSQGSLLCQLCTGGLALCNQGQKLVAMRPLDTAVIFTRLYCLLTGKQLQ